MASRAAMPTSGFRVRTASMVSSEINLSCSVLDVPARSATPVVATLNRSTSPLKVSVKPSQRASSPMLPSSWITHSTLLTPSSLKRKPAPCPATSSVWPTWVIAPSSWNTSTPELIVMTGMPAPVAVRTESRSASGFASETTIPSTPCATQSSISCACTTGSRLPPVVRSTPYRAAASLAPRSTTDQNEPVGSSCTARQNCSPSSWAVAGPSGSSSAAATRMGSRNRNVLVFIE